MSQSDPAALNYHARPTAGKISTMPTKPCVTQQDLALAYTPGVAAPCLQIRDNPPDVYKYTVKGNYVAVVSDGTAVLGLGGIGPEAGLPVMEGKCVLFKRFADIDAVPLCLGKVLGADGRTDVDRLVAAVETLEPSFGGINLEDIAAPACFRVEQELKRRMGIPVFHDDQHGTAIISLAAGAAVVGTGRTDFPNQINNVLGFPGIFRGALDCRARDITTGMQMAAARALAQLAQLPVAGRVREVLERAYPGDAAAGVFDGENPLKTSYVIPKPFDPRVVPHVARCVVASAMEEGVAQVAVDDLDAYEQEVAARIARAGA